MKLAVAYIGLGSNLDHPTRQLTRAIVSLRRLPSTLVSTVSPFYSNPALPVPGRPKNEIQPDFVNAVVQLYTGLEASILLKHMLVIETRQGRQRKYRWAPRTLDLDLLLYGQQRLRLQNLSLPHPELWQRPFVLYPLHDIAPHLRIPGYGCVKKLMLNCSKNTLKQLKA